MRAWSGSGPNTDGETRTLTPKTREPKSWQRHDGSEAAFRRIKRIQGTNEETT